MVRSVHEYSYHARPAELYFYPCCHGRRLQPYQSTLSLGGNLRWGTFSITHKLENGLQETQFAELLDPQLFSPALC